MSTSITYTAATGGWLKVRNHFDLDRRCAFARKIVKLNTESPLGGGRSKVHASRIARTGGALMRRFFSLAARFSARLRLQAWKFPLQFKHRPPRRLQNGAFISRPCINGGGQKSGHFWIGTGGQAQKKRRDIVRNCFFATPRSSMALGKIAAKFRWGGGRRRTRVR